MTNQQMLAAAIAALRVAYPRQEFPDASVAMYVRQLADLDAADVTAAIDRLVKRSTWLPSIAEIREDVAEATCALPNAAEAWTLMLDASFDSWPDVLRDTVRACGGRWSLVHNDRATVARAQFVADYEARRERALHVAAGADPLPALHDGAPTLPAVAELPESTSITPRPVYLRWLKRRWMQPPVQDAFPAPTDDELHDAILVLEQSGRGEIPVHHPMHVEAQRIMDEASA